MVPKGEWKDMEREFFFLKKKKKKRKKGQKEGKGLPSPSPAVPVAGGGDVVAAVPVLNPVQSERVTTTSTTSVYTRSVVVPSSINPVKVLVDRLVECVNHDVAMVYDVFGVLEVEGGLLPTAELGTLVGRSPAQ